MARETSRTITARKEVDLSTKRPVQLESQRRFFSNKGSDQATRQARALQDAFQVGGKFASEQVDRSNVQGGKDAAIDIAKGERDDTDPNFQYNKAWEEMDAERDYNKIDFEIREELKDADWANLEETEVQALITDKMAGAFAGAENLEHYGQAIAPLLSGLENELIAGHKAAVAERIQGEQRVTILDNVRNRFESSITPTNLGELDYEYLGDQTNEFFNGADKRLVYWESIFDFAIRYGRPDLIENTPERFRNGDTTRSNDPLFQDEYRAAIRESQAQAAKIQARRDTAAAAFNDTLRLNTQMEIYRRGEAGLPTAMLIDTLQKIPGTNFSHVSAAKGFGDSQMSERESRSPKYGVIGVLYAEIHAQVGSPSDQLADVFRAATAGDLGQGKTGVAEMNKLVSQIEQYKSKSGVLLSESVRLNRVSLNTRYNDDTGGILKGLNPLMTRVKIDANDMYNRLVIDGKGGFEALNEVIKHFDPIVADFPQIEEKEITGRRSQADFTQSRFNVSDIETVIETGDLGLFTGMPRFVLESTLTDMLNDGSLTLDQINEFGAIYQQ